MKITAALAFLLAAPAADAFVAKRSNAAKDTALFADAPRAPRLPPKYLDNKGLAHIFEKNQDWKNAKKAQDKKFFDKLGKIHTPEYMYIGCVDARVPSELIMGEEAGNIFVHRNVANLVVNNDVNLLSALQYGVAYLKVKHVIVCGHYQCGGIRAAESQVDHGAPLEQWLRNARDVYRMHRTELDLIEDPEARHRRFVDLNVIEQCLNIFKAGVIQQRRKETYLAGEDTLPKVHAMVFDPKTGDLKRIPFDFSEYEEDLGNVYGMHMLDVVPVLEEEAA